MPTCLFRRLIPAMLLGIACICTVAAAQDLSEWMIGVYADAGAHPSCVSPAESMFRWMGFSTRRVYAEDLNDWQIDDLAAIYFPGGDSPPYIERISPLAKQRLRTAISNGMAYIGTCAGAMFAAEVQVWEGVDYTDGQLGVFQGAAVGPAPGICGGEETCGTALRADPEHPVSQDASTTFMVRYYNSPYLEAEPDVETHVLASYVATGEPAIVAQRYGDGWVLLTGPHPEWERTMTWAFIKNCVLWSLDLLTQPEETENT